MVAVFATCKATHTFKSLVDNDCFWLEILAHLGLIAGWCFDCLLKGASAAQTQVRPSAAAAGVSLQTKALADRRLHPGLADTEHHGMIVNMCAHCPHQVLLWPATPSRAL